MDQKHQELVNIKNEFEKMEEESDLMKQVLNELSIKQGSLKVVVKQYLKANTDVRHSFLI